MGKSNRTSQSNKPSKARNIALDIIIVVALVIAGISAYKIYNIYKNYHKDQKAYTQVQQEAEKDDGIDWDALKATNSDVVGWIKLEGTNIDYPIVKSHDNDEYLHTLFDGSWGNAGCIFVDCNTKDPFKQFNTVVYGHHMKDGSMFENLSYFTDPSYAKEHGTFELFTPEQDYNLEVAAFLNCPSDCEIYNPNAGTGDDEDKNTIASREKYLAAIDKYAEYKTDVELTPQDKIVILSTCAYEYEGARYVIVGKL